jgi:hypothetical protein
VLRAAGEIGTSDRFDLDEGDLHIIFWQSNKFLQCFFYLFSSALPILFTFSIYIFSEFF